MVRRSRQRALTLLEILLVAGGTLLTLVLVAMVMQQSNRFARETQAYVQPQRDTTVLLKRLGDELANSSRTWIQTGAGSASVRFLSAQPANNQGGNVSFDPTTGALLWRKWVCYIWDSNRQEVTRYELSLATPTGNLSDEPAPAPICNDFPAYPRVRSQVVGREITAFEVAPENLASYTVKMTAHALTGVPGKGQTPAEASVSAQSTITILNP